MDIRSIHRGQTIEWEGKQRLCVWSEYTDFDHRLAVFSDGLILEGVMHNKHTEWEAIVNEQAFTDETLATGD